MLCSCCEHWTVQSPRVLLPPTLPPLRLSWIHCIRWPYYNLRDISLQCKTLEPISSFNTGYYGETDLGANLINFRKYVAEQLVFADLPANNAQVSMKTRHDTATTGWLSRALLAPTV